MESEDLLRIAREIVEPLPFCFAVTVAADGTANARVIQPAKPAADWSVRFMTRRRCRKTGEIEQSGHRTLGYLDEPARAHVTLLGPARIIDDVAVKRAAWTPASDTWYPDGPESPDVVIVELATQRIELWSAQHDIMPEPTGFSCAVLEREASEDGGEGWRVSTT